MDLSTLRRLPRVRAGRERAHALDAEVLDEQLRIVAIPAPPLGEAARGQYMAERFAALGLADVHTDAAGNVLARLPGPADESEQAVLVSAHLDTVFPADTNLTPRQVGTRIYAPGITDNARGLAALVGLARVLLDCRLRTQRPLWLAATVGEEGVGDLRGVKHLFRPDSGFTRATAFISLDGTGLRRIVHRGIGSRRWRFTCTGPGGHSWADYGSPNPLQALGAAIAALGSLELPASPATTLTVARCAGGSSINAIPAEAWLELDLRSESDVVLQATAARVQRAVEAAVAQENERRAPRTEPLQLRTQQIGDRPSGALQRDAPLVRWAVAATRAVGAGASLVASSTDANVPLSLGVPAVTIGAGGEGGGVHTLEEWFDSRDGARGIERALLLTLAAGGVESAGG